VNHKCWSSYREGESNPTVLSEVGILSRPCDSRTAADDRILEWLHFPDWTGVLRHYGVDGQQRNPLDSRLCHEDPIEGIFIKRWQTIDGDDVMARDWQLAVPIIQ
jgi:hypothetical protein